MVWSRAWTTGVRFLAEGRDFSLLQAVHNDSGSNPVSYAMSNGGSFPGAKATGACSHSELMNIFDGITYEGDQHIASLRKITPTNAPNGDLAV
jgi:hypothetical protein